MQANSVPTFSFTIRAEQRPETGKGAARRVRRAGKIPAVLYRAGNPSQPLAVPAKELLDGLRTNVNRNVLIGVQEGDRIHTCLIRDIDRHPVTRVVEHVDFYEVEATDVVTVDVPITTSGRSVGVRAGGILRQLVRSVKVRCSPLSIPATIDLDVTNLNVGEFLLASQLPAPTGTQVIFARDYNVVTVEGKRASKEEEAAAAAAATDAKGAAKPAAKAAPAAKAGPAAKAAPAAKPAAKK